MSVQLIVLTIMLSFLFISCSNKPELSLIIDDVLGYKLGNSYQVIEHGRSPMFLDFFGKYNGSYVIQIDEKDYLGLIDKAKETWKLQPSSKGTYKKWERITRIKGYDLISVSSFDTNNRMINVYIY